MPMDYLLEIEGKESERKSYQYFDGEGNKGRKVNRKQHILDLQSSGKLLNINADEISFSTKRKRSGLDGGRNLNQLGGPSKFRESFPINSGNSQEVPLPHIGQSQEDGLGFTHGQTNPLDVKQGNLNLGHENIIAMDILELIKNDIMDTELGAVTWNDEIGLELTKDKVADIFKDLDKHSKGLLLFGPPGSRKSLVGKCIASQTRSTFFSISSSSLTGKWSGMAENILRAVFTLAKVHHPSVIFIDEIDSLLTSSLEGEDESSSKIRMEVLEQLDNASASGQERVLVVGSTDSPYKLDEAVKRRFDKRLLIPLPELGARRRIITNLLSKESHELTDKHLDEVSRLTKGYSHNEIALLCEEVASGPVRSMDSNQLAKEPDKVQPIMYQDLMAGLEHLKASYGDLELYEEWDKQFGGVVISGKCGEEMNIVDDENKDPLCEVVGLSSKLKNEILKKKDAMLCLKLSSEQSDIKEVCKVVDNFRSEAFSKRTVLDQEFKLQLINLLTDADSSMDDIQRLIANSHFFLNDIFQEALALSSHKSVLKVFPPNLKGNFCLTLIEETRLFAPNLLSLLVKFCCKTNEPISENQARKVVHHISHLLSSLNQKNSLIQKLISLKLKLSSVTNSGLDFLNDLGITQSARSLQRDHDYLASLSRDHLVEELRGKSFNYLVDNLDKNINGNLENFTLVILVAVPEAFDDLSRLVDNSESASFFDKEYLKLDQLSEAKYMSAVVHILGHKLRNICPSFAWIRNVLDTEFTHKSSECTNKQTFWSYLSLLPLSEQKNSDMVEILNFCNEFTLEMLWKTSENPRDVKSLIDIVKGCDATDEVVEIAENELMELAKMKGLPSIIGDQLTYERAFIGQKLRQGAITKIESFQLLKFRLAMFHALMAKVRQDYKEFLPSLSNILDKGNLAYFRARLSKHEITNDGDKIKKGECSHICNVKDGG